MHDYQDIVHDRSSHLIRLFQRLNRIKPWGTKAALKENNKIIISRNHAQIFSKSKSNNVFNQISVELVSMANLLTDQNFKSNINSQSFEDIVVEHNKLLLQTYRELFVEYHTKSRGELINIIQKTGCITDSQENLIKTYLDQVV